MIHKWILGSGFVAVLLLGSNIKAEDKCHRPCERHDRRKCVKADIDSLKPALDWRDGQWCLSMYFKVELKRARPGDTVELVLTPQECGRDLVNKEGQPVNMVVALPVPDDGSDGELEFREDVSMNLAADLIGDPHRVKVLAEVVDRATNKLLDDKTSKAKVRCEPPRVSEGPAVDEVPVAVGPPPPPVYVEPRVVYAPAPVNYGGCGVRCYRPHVSCHAVRVCAPFVRTNVCWGHGVHVGVHVGRR